jgi:hypothetical protein
MPTRLPFTDKTESRKLRAEIRRILLEVWDPIGVKNEPNAQDEYDSYVGGVYELLESGATDSVLQDHLLQIERNRMGFNQPAIPDLNEVTRALRNIELSKLRN